MRINYSVVFVSDMARSVAFYRDVLGIPLKFESPEWSEFATDGATLALHRSDKKMASDDDLRSEAAGRCRTGFQVENIDEFHERMRENNVQCAQDPAETFGVRIAQYIDPDGLCFSVSESRTDDQ